MSHRPFVLFMMLSIVICVASCSEIPRATPGFQPLPEIVKIKPNSEAMLEKLTPEQRRQRYEESLDGRLCYYSQLVDQDGKPVPEALVFITLKKLGVNSSKRWDIYTHTDAEGRFSVVGGVGTKWYFSAVKAGYTRTGRGGELRGPDSLLSTPTEPGVVTMWKNTGFDRKDLIVHEYREKRFRIAWPPPPNIRIDLVRGIIAQEYGNWDVEVGLGDTSGGDDRKLTRDWMGTLKGKTYFKINAGKLVFVADPLPGRAPIPGPSYDFRYFPGVVVSDLKADSLTNFYRTDCHYFQFQSRGGRVHGFVDFDYSSGSETDPWLDLIVSGAINPTGSPALFEKEPTEKDFSTDGYEKSE
jgi:hypothetical protein